VILSCFASSIQRIQQVIDIAGRVGRKVAFVGRSMVDNVEIAHNLECLTFRTALVVSSAGHSRLRTTQNRHSRLRFASRADVFPLAHRRGQSPLRLRRRKRHGHSFVAHHSGNEKAIFRMLDHMFRRRALVYYDNLAGVIHVSGHATRKNKTSSSAREAEIFHSRSRRVSPSLRHAALAHQLGVVSGEILLLEDGHCIEFKEDGAFRREPVAAGRVLVDSGSLEEIEEVVVRERKHLSEDGVVVPIIAIDKHTGNLESQPKSSRADSSAITAATS